ncbi:MAG: ATP-binding protein [Ignavibacteria bacterium]|jgi:anti-sigma regulatory factor (Ser/Thr protein kinase)
MFSLTVKNDLKELNNIAEFIEDLSNKFSIEDGKKFDINLCIDEIVTNIIKYSYKDYNNHEIGINIAPINNELIATVTDDGNEFNPLKHNVYDITKGIYDKPIGGLGIYLVKQKADKIEYVRNNNKNILRLIFKIKD